MKTKQTAATAPAEHWRVAQPGTHGSKLRVVRDIGLTVEGKEISAGICEILTSRTSADGYSDATEQARAALIASAPDLLRQRDTLADALKALMAHHVCTPGNPADWSAMDRARAALATLEPQP